MISLSSKSRHDSKVYILSIVLCLTTPWFLFAQETSSISLGSKRIVKQKAKIDSLDRIQAPIKKIIRAHLNLCWTYLNVSGEFNEVESLLPRLDSLNKLEKNLNLEAETATIKCRLWTKQGYYNSAINACQHALDIRNTIPNVLNAFIDMHISLIISCKVQEH